MELMLAGRVGRYREEAPIPALQAHFRCAWSHVAPADHVGPVAVVPDGCVDLLWRENSLRVAGPDVTAALPELRPGATILGLRFQPGAARRWLGLPMSEITGREVELEAIWGKRARRLARMLEDAPEPGCRAGLLQAALAQLAAGIEPPDGLARAILRATAERLAGGSGPGDRLHDRLGQSERTLRRRSGDHFGYGTATLARILRLQRFLAAAGRPDRPGLASLAAETGYADQAHLAREVRDLCGMTASRLAAQLHRPAGRSVQDPAPAPGA
ncbi:helix-turn-helix domain-containing protein [Geminicoccus roseus]|uniref:helix-turn-helix domain-containing protein n=1 Tax=Geminicoccus roseus TaxID=404900 RepID=UPI0003F91D07|nr:helix-turn-helix domain-containing protein [Geminicoccus roseus]